MTIRKFASNTLELTPKSLVVEARGGCPIGLTGFVGKLVETLDLSPRKLWCLCCNGKEEIVLSDCAGVEFSHDDSEAYKRQPFISE
jgi:hypothetical protein